MENFQKLPFYKKEVRYNTLALTNEKMQKNESEKRLLIATSNICKKILLTQLVVFNNAKKLFKYINTVTKA